MRWVVLNVVVVVVAGLLLERANLPERKRHHQRWSLVFLLLLAAGCGGGLLSPRVSAWVAVARSLLPPMGPATFVFMTSMAATVAYAGVKKAVHWRLQGRPETDGRGAVPAYVEAGVEDERPGRYVADPPWYVAGRVARISGWGAALAFALAAGLELWPPLELVPVPILFGFVPLLFFEAAGYLLGDRSRKPDADEVDPAEPEPRTFPSLKALWEEVQQIWPDHVVTASSEVTLPQLPMSTTRPAGEPLDAETAWKRICGTRVVLDDVHRAALDAMWRGDDVILTSSSHVTAGPLVFTALHHALALGRRVLVVLPSASLQDRERYGAVEAWIRQGLRDADPIHAAWLLTDLVSFARETPHPHVLLATPAELLDKGAMTHAWFARVGPVVFLEGTESILADPLRASAMVRVLRSKAPGLQQIVLSNGRRNLEAAVRGTLACTPKEFALRPPPANEGLAVLFRETAPRSREGSGATVEMLHHRLFDGVRDRYLGAAPVLALPIWRAGFTPVPILGLDAEPWSEQREEIGKKLGGLTSPVHHKDLSGPIGEMLQITPSVAALEQRPLVAAVMHDRECNAPAALARVLSLGVEGALGLVVASESLMGGYFAAHMGPFTREPLPALAPRLGESDVAVAYGLFELLLAGWVPEAELLAGVRSVVGSAMHVEATLPAMLRETLGVHVHLPGELDYAEDWVFDPAARRFCLHRTYHLHHQAEHWRGHGWLRSFELLDDAKTYGTVLRDQLHQTRPPGARLALDGKSYVVKRVDDQQGRVYVEFKDVEAPPGRRILREVYIKSAEKPFEKRVVEIDAWTVKAGLFYGKVLVRQPGAYDVGRPPVLAGSVPYHIYDDAVPDRDYPHARFLRLAVHGPDGFDGAAAAEGVATLLSEALPSLFPESWSLLAVSAVDRTPRKGPLRVLRPVLTLGKDVASGAPFEVYAVEDAHAPVGLAHALYDALDDVLKRLDDLLRWAIDEGGWDLGESAKPNGDPEETTGERAWRRPSTDSYFLYGLKEPPVDLDAIRELFGHIIRENDYTRDRRQSVQR